MSQGKVSVLYEFRRLGTVEPNHDAMRKYRLHASNGVIKTKVNVQFHIFVTNVSDNPRQIPNKTLPVYVSANSLAMVTVPARIYNKVESFLCISGVSETEHQDKKVRNDVETMGIDVPSVPASFEDKIDLSGIEDPELRTLVSTMLEIHKYKWDGQLGEIVATRHRLELKPGSVPKYQITDLQGLVMRDATSKPIHQQIKAFLIEPSLS